VQLRTILQNVEILSVSPRTESHEGNALPVATVLIPPQDEDALALADSGARVRLALRNPNDGEVDARHAVALAALFQTGAKPMSGVMSDSARRPRMADTDTSRGIALTVWVIGASPAALRGLDSKLTQARSGESVQVTAFRDSADAEELVHGLARQHEFEILSSSRLATGIRQSGIVNAGAGGHLRIQFRTKAEGAASGLHVKPEVSWKRTEGGIESRAFEADVASGADFLVSGLLKTPADEGILNQLFPGRSWNGRELLIIVSAPHSKPIHTAALPKAGRRR
jgi:hypothetical protein